MSSNLTRLSAALDATSSGSWISVKDIGENTFLDVAFTKQEHDRLVAEQGGQAFWSQGSDVGVLERWNGAAFDESGDKLYFFGGGHYAYGGNEVYQFDLQTLSWTRLTEPAPLTGPEMSPNDEYPHPAPEEGPAARHTYDGFTWNPETQTIWLTHNGTNFTQKGAQPNDPTFWEFDPEARQWTGHDLTDLDVPNKSNYPIAAFNPETGQLVIDSKAENAVHIVQPDGTIDSRSSVADWDNKMLGNMEYNPADGKMYFIRKGTIYRAEQDEDGNLVWDSFVDDLPASFPGGKGGYTQVGFDFHEPSGRMVLWDGGDEIYTFDPATQEFRVFDAPAGAAAPADVGRVYSKFKYVSDADAFAAISDSGSDMWFYRLPDAEQGKILDPDAPRARVIDPSGNVTEYELIREAVDSAPDGATVEILPGTYEESATVSADNLTIRGEGVHIKNATAGGKATFVVNGNNTTFEGLEISGARVSDDQGSPIRLQAEDLTLRNVYFHDNQKGLIGGRGTVVIEDSRFENNSGREKSHGVYFSDEIEKAIIRNSEFIGMNSGGHEIKSRAKVTIIENSLIASGDGRDSRLIDISEGGHLTVRNSVLESGPNSTNPEMIGFGKEAYLRVYDEHSVTIEDSLIINDTGNSARWLDLDSIVADAPVTIKGNTFVGGDNTTAQYYVDGEPAGIPEHPNQFFFNRAEAGLDAYPSLPASPDAAFDSGLDTSDPKVINNIAPDAANDTINTVIGQPISFSVDELLQNDSDPNDNQLEFAGIGDPANGRLDRDGDQFTYTPNDGFTGTEPVPYNVTDGLGGVDQATIDINVQNVKDGRLVLTGDPNWRDDFDVSDSDRPYHIVGRGGHDVITGSAGGDLIIGGPGEDRIRGGPGNDIFVYAGRDNDADPLLDGGPGYDTIVGSDGDDVMRFKNNSPHSIERIEGGEGYDVIRGWDWSQTWDFSQTTFAGIELIDGHRNTNIIGSSGDDTFKASGSDRASIDGGGGRDTVVYEDVFAAYNVSMNENGGLSVTGRVNNTLSNVEVLRFADGIYADGAFRSDATPPPDGSAEDAFGVLGPSSNRVSTVVDAPVALDAYVSPVSGSRATDGGELIGFDPAEHGSIVKNGDGAVTYTPDPGFAGTDRLTYTVLEADGSERTGALSVTVRVPWEGSDWNDRVDFQDRDAPREIDVGERHDTVVGTPYSDLIRGRPGENRFSGGEGDDVFDYAGKENGRAKLVDGGPGFDVLAGSHGDDVMQFRGDAFRSIELIEGGDGYDVIRGWKWTESWDFSQTEMTGIELIDTAGGQDSVVGTAGPDVIRGGPGADQLWGGKGDDTFDYAGKDNGRDKLVDGGPGYDAVVGSNGDDVMRFNSDTLRSIERIDGGEGYDVIRGGRWTENWDFSETEMTGIELIDAAGGHDNVVGSPGTDLIRGGPGEDRLWGGKGDDVFDYTGKDNGRDSLVDGGPGFDTVAGSNGDDVMQFRGEGLRSIERIDGGGGYDVIRGWKGSQSWDFSDTDITGIELIDGYNATEIVGSNGDDTFKASGSDGASIDGGAGRDAVVFDDPFANYTIEKGGNGGLVISGAADVALSNVEVLQFADGVYSNDAFLAGEQTGAEIQDQQPGETIPLSLVGIVDAVDFM